jgi:cell division septation protein DedD
MNAGMRDLERIEEHEPGEGTTRKLAMVGLLGFCLVAVTLAVGVLMGNASETEAQQARDPLAALADAQNLAPERGQEEAEPEQLRPVVREALTFPQTLLDDAEPSLEAAASAELEHPDSLDIAPPSALFGNSLPASVAAGPQARNLARDAASDPVLAAALPGVAPREVERAAEGSDGPYTLQVISSRSEAEARVFAEALRSRGHAAFVTHGEVEGRGTFYRVRVGPFETRRRAERYRSTFEQEEGMNTFVFRRRDTNGGH